jgi:hypothetical protein
MEQESRIDYLQIWKSDKILSIQDTEYGFITSVDLRAAAQDRSPAGIPSN